MRAFLELLRPPNVTTALADVLAGFAIANLGNSWTLPWLLIATACLYGGGVVLNDYFDRAIDAVERPERPIPSGRVRPAAAARFGASLLGVGVLAATRATREAALVACLIAGAILVYDTWSKHHSLLGPVTMGACRGLNLMLGVAAVPAALSARWELGLLPFTYICAITAVSRGEVHGGRRQIAGFALVAVAGVVTVLAVMGTGVDLWEAPFGRSESSTGRYPSPVSLLLTTALGWRVLRALWRAYQEADPVAIRLAVRTGVLSLVLLDAALAAIYAGTLYGLLVIGTALLAAGLARLFAVT